jgi:hypothetical protein
MFLGGAIWKQKQSHMLCEYVALAEFGFRRLVNVSWNRAIVMRSHSVRHCTSLEVRTTGRLRTMGMHNISENDCGAKVALRANPTFTH